MGPVIHSAKNMLLGITSRCSAGVSGDTTPARNVGLGGPLGYVLLGRIFLANSKLTSSHQHQDVSCHINIVDARWQPGSRFFDTS